MGNPINTKGQAARDHPAAVGKIAGEAAGIPFPEGGHAPRTNDRQLGFSQDREVPFYVGHGGPVDTGQQRQGVGRVRWGKQGNPVGLRLLSGVLKAGLGDRFQEPRGEARASGPGKRCHVTGA